MRKGRTVLRPVLFSVSVLPLCSVFSCRALEEKQVVRGCVLFTGMSSEGQRQGFTFLLKADAHVSGEKALREKTSSLCVSVIKRSTLCYIYYIVGSR